MSTKDFTPLKERSRDYPGSKDTPVIVTSFEKEVKRDDFARVNLCLLHLDWAFDRVVDVDGLCKVINTTMSVLEKRRHLLGLPYGQAHQKDGDEITLDMDD